MALLALLIVLVAADGWPSAAAADDRPTLKVDPASQNVAPGQQFTLNIVQSSTLQTTGAQVNVVYDPALLQLKDFALGPVYTSANAIFAFGNAELGTSGKKDLAMARSNKFGTLENAAGFLLPGSGVVSPGDNVFLTLTFVALASASGPTNIGLIRGSMIDAQGNPLDPHLLAGTVTVGAGGSPGPSGSPAASGGVVPSGSPGASASASAVPSPMPEATAAPVAPVSPTGPVSLMVAPTSLTLKSGNTARVFIVANADGNLSSVTTDLTFDPGKLEITSMDPGPAWGEATVIAVATDKAKSGVAGAIGEANTTGVLQQAGAFFAPGAQNLPYGEGVVVSVMVKAKADGTIALSIGNAAALGVQGESLKTVIATSSVTKPPEKGVQLDPTLVIPLVLLLVLGIAALVVVRSGRIPVRVRRRWPYYVSLALGMIPVVLLAVIVVTMVVRALPVVTTFGVGILFGSDYFDEAGKPQPGGITILAPLWNTILITVIAAGIGLPVALASAVAAVEFPMGRIGRLVRPVIGMLSGVPPIVYAISVPVFVTAFMIPKFTGNLTSDQFNANISAAVTSIGGDPSTWPPPGVPAGSGGLPNLPWSLSDPNSTLLGGLLVALFLVPFVTPLFVDALRDVPRAAREGSHALGASRVYTLRRVVLPRALPAIGGAATLAVLKAMGDAVILLFAVGTTAGFGVPLLDVLERNTGLGAWSSAQIGSLDVLQPYCKPAQCAIGYTGALLLLLVAGVAVLVLTYLQARGRRRVAV
jgi:phosphate transport system permease protein